jgi:hypothetical protein
VLLYVKHPLSLRNVEDLLAERGIDISHKTVRYWWNRFDDRSQAWVLREFRWFFSALLIALAASIAKNLVLTGSLPQPINLAAHLLFIAIAIAALLSRSTRIQLMLALAGLAMLCGYISLLFTTLS